MNPRNDPTTIQQIRRELLVILKVVYPAVLSADVLFRALLGAFPHMEWDYFHKDVAYLIEKGYVRSLETRVRSGADPRRDQRRMLRLSPSGVELADRCTDDVALRA